MTNIRGLIQNSSVQLTTHTEVPIEVPTTYHSLRYNINNEIKNFESINYIIITLLCICVIISIIAIIDCNKQEILLNPVTWAKNTIQNKITEYKKFRSMTLPIISKKAKESPFVSSIENYECPHYLTLNENMKCQQRLQQRVKHEKYTYEPLEVDNDTKITIYAVIEGSRALPPRHPPRQLQQLSYVPISQHLPPQPASLLQPINV